MIRLVNGLLIVSCLFLGSCNFPDNSGQTKRSSPSNNQPKRNAGSQATNTPPPIDWLGANESVEKAKAKFAKDAVPQPTVKQVLDEINKAVNKLPKEEEVDVRCGICGEDAQSKTKNALTLLTGIAKELKGKDDRKLDELDQSVTAKIKGELDEATRDLTAANSSYSQALVAAGANNSNNNNNGDNNTAGGAGDSSWTDLIWPIAGAVAGLGLIVLAVFGILRWRAGFWMKLDRYVSEVVSAHVGGMKRRHDEMAKNLAAIGEDQKKTSSRLESIEGEIQALGRRLRHGVLDGGYQAASVKQAFDEHARQPLPIEPEFPAAADQYLNKMKRNSIVVKPDFQNGILVNDIDGKGELVLIRDASVPDDAQPLFVVPRVTQFQSKQEFHAYYERYYDCQRPSAGDVWIIDPAVVSTVPGGWQLREKGVLEVR